MCMRGDDDTWTEDDFEAIDQAHQQRAAERRQTGALVLAVVALAIALVLVSILRGGR